MSRKRAKMTAAACLRPRPAVARRLRPAPNARSRTALACLLGQHPAPRLARTPRQLDHARPAVGLQFCQKHGHRPFEFGRRQVAEAAQPLGHLRRRCAAAGPGRAAGAPPDGRPAGRAGGPCRSGATQLVEQVPVERPAPARRPSVDAVVLVHVGGGEREQQARRERRRHLGAARLDLDAARRGCRPAAAAGAARRDGRAGTRGTSRRRRGSRRAGGPPGAGRGRAAAAATAAPACPAWPRGSSSARAAFCRKRRANRALSASSSRISPSTFSGVRPVEQVEDRLVGVGQADEDAVVVVQALRPVAEPLPQPRLERQAQGEVQPAAERAEQDHLPVAELVARRLDEEGAGRSAGSRPRGTAA